MTIFAHKRTAARISYKTISFVGFLFFISGCSYVVDRYYVSDAVMDSGESQITRDGKLSLNGVLLNVRPANALHVYTAEDEAYSYGYYEEFGYGRTKTPDYFIFEILLQTGNTNITIAPDKIYLKIDNREISAMSYFSLERRYSRLDMSMGSLRAVPLCKGHGVKSWSGENPLKSSNEILSSNVLKLDKNTDYCLAIKFKTSPPNPRTDFSVHINGISINGNNISVPIIKYVPATYIFRHA